MVRRGAFDFDVAVIGGGSGGYAAARTAAAGGAKTVVIEGGAEVGGLCILRGCMPTKALLYAAEVRQLARHSRTFGIHAGEVGFDFSAVMERKKRLIQEFADYRAGQLSSGKFEFIRENARFVDSHTLKLGGAKQVTASHFVIATGSVVAPSPIQQLQDLGYWTSDDALRLDRLPKSLIVLGAGAVGVELAQFFQRLDVEVTLVQRSSHILKGEETAAAEVVENVLRREGMRVFTDTKLTGATRHNGLKVIHFEHEGQMESVAAEEILFALGRVPNVQNLALDQAGITCGQRGISVTTEMRTNVPHVFSVGDCTGLHEIVHIAIQQGEIAAHNILNPSTTRQIDYRLLTSVVFTEPQLARVGATENELKQQGIPYLTAQYPFNDHGKSMIMNAVDGFVKLIASPKSGEILGGTCVGPIGGELIHEIVVAMAKRMTVQELATVPHYHPTLAEIWTYPAEELAEQINPASRVSS
ncbi:MAG: dihydrolipoyl dehydrogenase [Pedosphaera sp.]|nr:dihydrolipoyl dehydrogenase [Pedosphaera sp.]